MESSEGDGTLFVPFTPGLVRIQGQSATTLLSIGAVLWIGGWIAVHAIFDLPAGSAGNIALRVRMVLLIAVLVASGPFFVLMGLYSLLIYLDRRDDRKPALVIGPNGVLWGLGLGKPFFLPWSELAAIDLDEGLRGEDEPIAIQLVPRNAAVLKSRVGAARWLFATTSGRLTVRRLMLAAPWPEIATALDRFGTLNPPPPAILRPASPRPKTLKEFEERFREGPLGVWTTRIDFYPPIDTMIWFDSDGAGGIAGSESHPFEWRTQGDWTVEIRRKGEDDWGVYDYSFSEHGDGVGVFFEGELQRWTRGLGAEIFVYAGSCLQDYPG